MFKRGRTDGHLSKEEYHQQDDDSSISKFQSISNNHESFAKASPDTLASRKMVYTQKNNKKEQFAKHIEILNESFYSWLNEQLKSDAYSDLTAGFQDYIDHVVALEDRYLRTYGEVLTFGSGDCGQLAHGIENDEDLMVKYPRIVYALRDKKVCGIACGGIHNAVYTESGQVYTWGCSDDGSLGRIGEESVPIVVDALIHEIIIGVACGDGQTIAVTATGDVYGWGCYKDKEGKKFFNPSIDGNIDPKKDIKKQQNIPLKIKELVDIVEIGCGSSFNIAKNASGTLYSWGLGECGELGRKVPSLKIDIQGEMEYDLANILKHHITPGNMYYNKNNSPPSSSSFSNNSSNNSSDSLSLQIMMNVKSFGCGAYHSLVVGLGDVVYACGLNNYGQLGLGGEYEKHPQIDNLTLVPLLCNKGIISLKGGVHHSLALSSSGRIYSFGRGDSGQLGSNAMSSNKAGDFSSIPVFPDIPEDIDITAISCGGNHNLALTAKSEVYSWGYGDMLALGHGEEKDEILPKKLNFSKAKLKNFTITQVAGGGQHSAIIGKVVTA